MELLDILFVAFTFWIVLVFIAVITDKKDK